MKTYTWLLLNPATVPRSVNTATNTVITNTVTVACKKTSDALHGITEYIMNREALYRSKCLIYNITYKCTTNEVISLWYQIPRIPWQRPCLCLHHRPGLHHPRDVYDLSSSPFCKPSVFLPISTQHNALTHLQHFCHQAMRKPQHFSFKVQIPQSVDTCCCRLLVLLSFWAINDQNNFNWLTENLL